LATNKIEDLGSSGVAALLFLCRRLGAV